MRINKYRAWDGKRMTTSGIMFNNSTGCIDLPIGAQMKLMQFAGLHDRNGKDVFEGDILKNPKGEIGFVTFREGCFFLECKRKNGNTIFLTFSGGLMLNKEIIGNRFENPELL